MLLIHKNFIFFKVPGLAGGKMSSSEADSKLDLLDPPEVVKSKLENATCEAGKIEDNGLLAFVKHAIFPIFHEIKLTVEETKNKTFNYENYPKLEADFKDLVSQLFSILLLKKN